MRCFLAARLLPGVFAVAACSGNGSDVSAVGGAANSMGGTTPQSSSTATVQGGATSAVGAGGSTTQASSGGSTPTGGSSNSMIQATGTGGIESTLGTGGSTSNSSGGSGAVGARATGGAVNSGGTNNAQGGSASGGLGTGGANATGGTTNVGGTSATGGSKASTELPQLHTDGNLIKDPNGKTIVLRGSSLIDIGTLYANANSNASGITTRIDQVISAGIAGHVIRLPVYPRTCFNTGGQAFNSRVPFPVGTAGGTQTNLTAEEYLSNVLKPAVDYVTQKGMYVIIDYHQIDNTNGQSATDATTFWTFMAAKFADYSNVFYEAYNEPIDSMTSWSTFKSRAQNWVDTIRVSAPNNIILVPSMSYDQKPGDAASSPLSGTDLIYVAHIYPGNWNAGFKQQVATAVAKVPVFISEWGYVLNGSDGTLGTSSATWGAELRALVDGNGASWTAWVTDNAWTPNLFASTAMTTLTDFGTTTKTWLADKASSDWVQ